MHSEFLNALVISTSHHQASSTTESRELRHGCGVNYQLQLTRLFIFGHTVITVSHLKRMQETSAKRTDFTQKGQFASNWKHNLACANSSFMSPVALEEKIIIEMDDDTLLTESLCFRHGV